MRCYYNLIWFMVLDPLSRIRVKVARAGVHQRELRSHVQAFLATNPYRVTTRTDPITRRLIYYVGGVENTPVEISSVAGDVLQNLRSALDHLAFELFLIGTRGRCVDGKHVSFPIFDDRAQYNRHSPARLEGVRADAKAAIDALKPYRGGNDVLWRLHRLNIVDKHRFLITVGSSFRSLDLGAHMHQLMVSHRPELENVKFPAAFFKTSERMFPLKAGDDLFIDAPDAKPNPKMRFLFEVALRESGVIDGESLTETLQQMMTAVNDVVSSFDDLLK